MFLFINHCFSCKWSTLVHNELLFLQGDTVSYFLDNLKRIGQPVSFQCFKVFISVK